MAENESKRKTNPLATANIISQILFIYISPLLRLANRKKDVKPDDLYEVLPKDRSNFQHAKLSRVWQKEIQRAKKKGVKPSLLRALFVAYGPWYAFLSIGAMGEEILRITQPILLGLLIDYFVLESKVERSQAFIYAGLVSLNTICLALVHGPYYWQIMRLGMHIRVALGTSVYHKVLKLSNKSLQSATIGKVNNIMTTDVNTFDRLFIFLHYLWLGPLEAIIIMYFLYREIQWACLPGYVVMLFLIPAQARMGKLFATLRRKTARFTDKRVAVMTEIITAMRVIKMYAWENAFGEVVRQIRKSEIAKVITASYPIGTNLLLSLYGNRLLDVGMIITYALTTTEPISASTVFVVVSFCRTLTSSFMRRFPQAIQLSSECWVATDRIEEILLSEEKEQALSDKDCLDLQEDTKIEAEGVYCSWNDDEEADANTLKDMSYEVKKGQLTAVVGPVGCGKSSLLMSIIKELPVKKGSLKVGGSVSFAAQQPWVFSGTLRENVLFGKEFEKEKFDEIIKVCALKRDLELLPDGDQTMIGERGVTLSGGQKARINLARALYDGSDIVLLDDPLSAVDSEVGRHIFDKCIMGYLADKPRILVTHQLQYLATADQIIVLKDGHIEGKGTLSELNEMGIDFAKLMGTDSDEEEEDMLSLASAVSAKVRKREKKEEEPSENVSQKLFKAEQSKKGDVGWGIYGRYFMAGTNWFGIACLIFFLLSTQVVYILSDYWLALWTDLEEARTGELANLTTVEDNLIFGSRSPSTERAVFIYGMLILGLLLLGLVRAFLALRIMISSSKNLHNKMFAAVVRSPIFFFDTNPTGRIQNRFTKDIGTMDGQLPLSFFDVLQLLLQVLGVIILNAVINYFTLILILPLLVLFVFIRRYSVNATRPVKRLDGVTRSPVFSHTTASIYGLSTIRAYNKEGQFCERFSTYQDRHTEAWISYLLINRWFGMRLDLLTSIFTSGVSFAAVLASGSLDAGLVGVILNNTFSLSTQFQFTVRQTAVVENQMTSVERVMEYAKLKPEAPLETPETKPPKGWPGNGSVSLRKMSLRYSDESPLVLKNVSCEIESKEKVGIVGRTGAGKSSLITALFRLAEPSGNIVIDGVNCLELGLHDLRKQLSIIPQDPVLFKGSLRRNLDPFGEYGDEDLWNALREVQLHHALANNSAKLEMDVGVGGSNFSVGQRQLVCLARAIVRRNKILILDEATANVDPRTDSLIQETIRSKFEDCTVLTIAHRLNTIMDSDRVMLLDAGELKEFEHPHILLQDQESLFYKLVEQTGKQEASKLAEIARSNFVKDERVLPEDGADGVDVGVLAEREDAEGESLHSDVVPEDGERNDEEADREEGDSTTRDGEEDGREDLREDGGSDEDKILDANKEDVSFLPTERKNEGYRNDVGDESDEDTQL
ncbi:ATP-binding cassette sub-family C member 4-like isoform X2 [Apostichopus japonicus]|uniref:ATP-binding cassette sub-family C member 4-like isoform X2 n=1 Tax=Stichopus japonicus TaxID=307972 RepID=UPI003AB138B8